MGSPLVKPLARNSCESLRRNSGRRPDLVRLFLDDSRLKSIVDGPLHGGSMVVVAINGSGKIDELGTEIGISLAKAEGVFDDPDRQIYLIKIVEQGRDVGRDAEGQVSRGLENREFEVGGRCGAWRDR